MKIEDIIKLKVGDFVTSSDGIAIVKYISDNTLVLKTHGRTEQYYPSRMWPLLTYLRHHQPFDLEEFVTSKGNTIIAKSVTTWDGEPIEPHLFIYAIGFPEHQIRLNPATLKGLQGAISRYLESQP